MDKNTEREIREKLQSEEKKRALNKHFGESYNTYAEAAIIFFGTLGPLYFLFFLVHWVFMFTFGAAIGLLNININWIAPLIHGTIWIAAIYSVYRKRSILDDLYKTTLT